MTRGHLRIYIGVATGVGKTCAVLAEAERRARRGTDVVLGCVDGRGRPETEAAMERVRSLLTTGAHAASRTHTVGAPGAVDAAIGSTGSGAPLDLDAILRRAPAVVVVDDLEAVNPPTQRNPHRWQDVDELLAAGIDVIATLNAEHLESLADVVPDLTGAAPAPSVPDWFVRAADQIEVIDMDPSALLRRVAHGNVLGVDELDMETSAYFRPESLATLRELALLWVADRVDADLRRHGRAGDEVALVETKTRVVVAMTSSPGGEALLRRGARLTDRIHGELVGVHVHAPGAEEGADPGLDAGRRLLTALGGRYAQIAGDDVASALVTFARAENATQLVLGGSSTSRRPLGFHRSIVKEVLDISDGIDVHVIAALPEPAPDRRRRSFSFWPTRPSGTGLRLAWMLAILAAPSALAVAQSMGGAAALPVELLFFVVLVSAIAWSGGWAPAAAATLIGVAAAQVAASEVGGAGGLGHLLEITLFLAVSTAAIALVTRLRKTEARLRTATNEAEALARLAGGSVLGGPEPLSRLVAELCHTFELTAVAVLEPTERGWKTIASAGRGAPKRPSEAAMEAQLNDGAVLVMSGDIDADDQRLLSAFITQLRAAQHQVELETKALQADAHRQANQLRDGLLMAVSHDLRTPLATIKLSAGSLASDDVDWALEDVRTLARGIENDADQLHHVVGEVLDLSRLQSGALGVHLRATDVAVVVDQAVATVPHAAGQVITSVTRPRPIAQVDPALLERVVANLVDNAVTWSPPGELIHVRAGVVAGAIEVRVVDRGPGIAPTHRGEVFRPFQRLGDGNNANETGLGLGLALSRGFVDAMGGSISIEDTPGGGTTMVVRLERDEKSNAPHAPKRQLATHGAR